MSSRNLHNTGNNEIKTLKNLRKHSLVILLVLLTVFFSCMSANFFTVRNFSNLLIVQITTGCIALGSLLVLITGDFDLSLGYLLGFDMVLGAYMGNAGAPAFLIILAMLLAGVAIGCFSGFLTVVCRINSFISTLAVGITLSGFSIGISGGALLSKGIPSFIMAIGRQKFLGIGIGVWIFIFLCLVCFFILEYTTYGRSLYAIGGSKKVAYMAGIKIAAIRISAFAAAGMLASVGAVISLGQTGSALPSYGNQLLLPAYAVVFLGITAYKPGSYNLPGSIMALLILGVGLNGMSMLGAPYWAEPMFNGLLLIAAILAAIKETRSVKVGQ